LRTLERFAIFLDFTNVPAYNVASRGWRIKIVWTAGPFVRHNSRGDHVDQQLKQMMKELGEAINESLADSEAIAEVVSRIKEGGYDIFLVLEATIGVSKPGEKTDKTSLVTTLSSDPELKVSDQDLKFLKSLRIKIEEDAA